MNYGPPRNQTDDEHEGSREATRASSAPMKVAIYTRAHTGSSELDRQELAYQLWNCRKESARLGFEVVAEVHDRGVPAGLDADRPGWSRVVGLIRSREVNFVVTCGMKAITETWDDLEPLLGLVREFGVDFIGPAPFRRTIPPPAPEESVRESPPQASDVAGENHFKPRRGDTRMPKDPGSAAHTPMTP